MDNEKLRQLIFEAVREVKFKVLPNSSKKAFFAKLTSGKVKGGHLYGKGKDGKRANVGFSSSIGLGREKDKQNIDNIVGGINAGNRDAEKTSDALFSSVNTTMRSTVSQGLLNNDETKKYKGIVRGQSNASQSLSNSKNYHIEQMDTAKKFIDLLYDNMDRRTGKKN